MAVGPRERGAVAPHGRFATVRGIEGTTLTLATVDGWTRSVDTTGVPITRGDAIISAADIRVGDTVGVSQRRADDGTWQVTAIRVRLTVVRGTVAAVASDGFTLATRAGTSTPVRVSDDTSWGCRLAGGLSAVEIGATLVAQGVSAADGSLDATAVATSGIRMRRERRGETRREIRREMRRDSRREIRGDNRRELRRETGHEHGRDRVRRGSIPSPERAPTASPMAVAPSA